MSGWSQHSLWGQEEKEEPFHLDFFPPNIYLANFP